MPTCTPLNVKAPKHPRKQEEQVPLSAETRALLNQGIADCKAGRMQVMSLEELFPDTNDG